MDVFSARGKLPHLIGIGGLVIVFGAVIVSSSDCGSTSKAAKFARGLSQRRLADIHEEIVRLKRTVGENFSDQQLTGNRIPVELQDLKPKLIRLGADRMSSSIIRLDGCYDDHLDLVIDEQPERISLRTSEISKNREVLWRNP